MKQISNINSSSGAYPYLPTGIGDDLYFYADTGPSDQLFRTSGDVTVQVTNIYPINGGVAGSYRSSLPPVQTGSSILFSVASLATSGSGSHPDEIWRTNAGLAEGAELYWRSTGAVPVDWQKAGDLLYILMRSGGADELWVTDGVGSMRLVQGGFGNSSRFVGSSADAAYFHVSLNATPYWRAASGGVTALDTLGVFSGEAGTAVVLGDDFYVHNGAQVVRVAAGSTKGEVVLNGGWDASLQKMYAAAGMLFLVDAPGPFGGGASVLWRYDPVQARLDRIGSYQQISTLGAMGEDVYFAVEPSSGAARLMRLSHSSTTAVEVAAIGPAGGSSDILELVIGNAFVYLHVIINNGRELWGSDGTGEGTRSIARIWDYAQVSKFDNCPCMTVAGGTLYFDRMASAKSVEMWRVNTTGTEAAAYSLYLPSVRR